MFIIIISAQNMKLFACAHYREGCAVHHWIICHIDLPIRAGWDITEVRIHSGFVTLDIFGRDITYPNSAVIRFVPDKKPSGNIPGVIHL